MLGTSISYPHQQQRHHSNNHHPHHHHHQQQQHTRDDDVGVVVCCDVKRPKHQKSTMAAAAAAAAAAYPPATYDPSSTTTKTTTSPAAPHQKDYSRPLHVDCSVEYELPNAAKPPQGMRNEPLLMIHPCYFRKIESQRRSPFINNLPNSGARQIATPKRRARGVQQQQQYPWEQHHHNHLVPVSNSYAIKQGGGEAVHWTDPEHDRSPDKPDDQKSILSGKYRQYLRSHRFNPYGIGLGCAAFPQQVCYNV